MKLSTQTLRPFFERQGIVFMFHRILSAELRSKYDGLRGLEVLPELYESLLSHYKKRRFKFLSAAELSEHIAAAELPKKYAVVTFDDGYRDNLDPVANYMAEKKLPWTLYLTTGFCDRTLPCWWYGLGQLLDRHPKIDAALIGGQTYTVSGLGSYDLNNLYNGLRNLIHSRWADSAHRANVDAFFRAHEIDLLSITDQLALSWKEIKLLDAMGCDIAAHTDQHLNLKECASKSVTQEMMLSKSKIEANLDKPVKTFAYPFGDMDSCDAREFSLAKECGFKLAFTTRNKWLGQIDPKVLWNLPRLNISGSWDRLDQVLFRTSGWSQVSEWLHESRGSR